MVAWGGSSEKREAESVELFAEFSQIGVVDDEEVFLFSRSLDLYSLSLFLLLFPRLVFLSFFSPASPPPFSLVKFFHEIYRNHTHIKHNVRTERRHTKIKSKIFSLQT